MITAFQTWEAEGETLEDVERRIHDNVSLPELKDRARAYVKMMFELFPWAKVSPVGTAVEVGPGVGYIMEAFLERKGIAKLIGLDVASGMIKQARQRMLRDRIPPSLFEFVHYDGLKFPFEDASIDFFYSVAAIQHVPKPLAYNIFSEMTRCLKPQGFAIVHLLNWDQLPLHAEPWSSEVNRQIRNEEGHWHHYYAKEELEAVFENGLKVPYFQVRQRGTFIWVAWCNNLSAFESSVKNG